MTNTRKDVKDSLILDPSFFAYGGAVLTFIKSELWKEHRIIVPTSMYDAIQVRNREKFDIVLNVWEGVPYERLKDVWNEIMDSRNQIVKTFVSCKKVLEELSEDKREALHKVEKTLGIPEYRRRPRGIIAIEIAREIVMTACVTSLILSISDKAKKWYDKLNGTIVKKVEENRTLMKIKREYRETMKNAGWKGRVLIWLAKHTPMPYSGDVVDVVTIIFADGTYRCPNCGRSLHKLPLNIKFCPYCSTSLL